MQGYPLKYIPSDAKRGKKLATNLRIKNFKHFGSLPLDNSFRRCLRSHHLKSVNIVRFDLSSSIQASTFFSQSNSLKRCSSLAVRNYQKDYYGKLRLSHFLKQANKIANFILEADVGFDFIQSNHYLLARNMMKYFRLRNLSIRLFEYGNNLDLCLPGDKRKIILKNLIKQAGKQQKLRTLCLNFCDYTIETNYASELDHINQILSKLPYLSCLDLGQPFGSMVWDQESSRRLILNLGKAQNLKRFDLLFDKDNSRMDLHTVCLINKFNTLKHLELTLYVTKGLIEFIKTVEESLYNLESLNITIYIKEDCPRFWILLGSWLNKLSCLKELAINYKNHFSVDTNIIKPFLKGISQLRQLQKLDLRGPFEKNPKSFLIMLLKTASALENLTQVRLESYTYSSYCNDKDMKVILDAIEAISLKLHGLSLIFGANKITEVSLKALEQALTQAKNLKQFELAIRPSYFSENGLEILNKIIQERKGLNKMVLDIVGKGLSKDNIKGLVKNLLNVVRTGKVEFTAHTVPPFEKEDIKEIKALIRANKRGENWLTYFPCGYIGYRQYSESQDYTSTKFCRFFSMVCQGVLSMLSERFAHSKRLLLH